MKNLYLTKFIYMLLLIFVNSSCQEDIITENNHNSVQRLSAVVEKSPSRAAWDLATNFYWAQTDTISVYGSETQNAPYVIESSTANKGIFKGYMDNMDDKPVFAFFPYGSDVNLNGGELIFNLPKQRDINGNYNSPMVGYLLNDDELNFYHAGGTLFFRITGLPDEAATLELTSIGDNTPYLSGVARIDDINENNCTYTIEEGNNNVIFSLLNVSKGHYVHYIYVPLQTGDYEKIIVQLKDIRGNVLKEKSISDFTIERASILEMPTVNFSETIYGYKLTEEELQGSEWTDVCIYSTDQIIAFDNDNKRILFSDLNNIRNEEKPQMLEAQLDAEGRLSMVTFNNRILLLSNYNGNKVDITVVYDDDVEFYAEQEIEFSARSRASIQVDTGIVGAVLNDIFNVVDFVSGVTPKGVSRWSDTINFVTGFNDVSGEGVSILIGGGMILVAAVFLPAEAAITSALIVAGFLTAVKAMRDMIVNAILESTTTWTYKTFCGNAKVTLKKPKQINESQFNVGYTLSGTSSIPKTIDLKLGKISNPFGFTHGIIIEKYPAGKLYRENYLTYANHNAEHILLNSNVSTDNTFTADLNFERGYTYYMKAFFGLTENGITIPFFYFSDMEQITFDDAKIEYVTNRGRLIDGKYHFDISVLLSCKDDASAWTVCLLKNDEIINSTTWNKRTGYLYFETDLTLDDLNPADLTSKDKWSIGILSNTQNIKEFIDVKEFTLKYKQAKGVMMERHRVTATRVIESRALNDNNDEKYYESDIEVDIQVSGAGWFSDIVVYSTKGDTWSFIENGKLLEDTQTVTIKGTITYSERNPPPFFYCYGVFHGTGTKFKGTGVINFPYIPIPIRL